MLVIIDKFVGSVAQRQFLECFIYFLLLYLFFSFIFFKWLVYIVSKLVNFHLVGLIYNHIGMNGRKVGAGGETGIPLKADGLIMHKKELLWNSKWKDTEFNAAVDTIQWNLFLWNSNYLQFLFSLHKPCRDKIQIEYCPIKSNQLNIKRKNKQKVGWSNLPSTKQLDTKWIEMLYCY